MTKRAARYIVTCSNGQVTIDRVRTNERIGLRTLAKAKREAHDYVRAYAQAPRADVRWAHQAISLLSLSEFRDDGTWCSPDF